jgi:hypothetical protein
MPLPNSAGKGLGVKIGRCIDRNVTGEVSGKRLITAA